MELVVRKNELLRELQLFQGIVERKNTIPILANVLIEASGDEVKLLATDLEVGLRSKCSASITKGGSLTLPAKKLFEIIRMLPETEIRIEQDKSGVRVAADRFDSKMQAMAADDFPSLPHPAGTPALRLPAGRLGEMIARTQFATTSDDTRYFLNGVLLVSHPEHFSLVATDGHRLALTTAPRGSSLSAGFSAHCVENALPQCLHLIVGCVRFCLVCSINCSIFARSSMPRCEPMTRMRSLLHRRMSIRWRRRFTPR